MAAVKITSANSNSIGPTGRHVVRTSGGTLYAAVMDSTSGQIEIWKSSDGSSWSSVGSTTAQDAHAIAIDSSDKIHCLFFTSDKQIKYNIWLTSTDAWDLSPDEEMTSGGTDAPSVQWVSVAIDSFDLPHVVYSFGHKNMGTVYDSVHYRYRVGGSFTSAIEVEGGLGGTTHCRWGDITFGDEDFPEVAYVNVTDGDLGTAVGDANPPSGFTLQDIDTSAKTTAANTPSIIVDSGGNTTVVWIDSTDDLNSRKLPDGKQWDSLTPSTGWDATETIDSTDNWQNPSLLAKSTDRHLVVEDVDDHDIAYFADEGSGWGSKTVIETGTYETVKGGWSYLNDGFPSNEIHYVFKSGTDIYWNKISLTADVTVNVPAGSLSLTGYAPTPDVTDHKTVSVPAGALSLTGQAPKVNLTVPVGAGSLALTAYVPTVDVTEHKTINVPVAALSLSAFPPTAALGPLAVPVPAGALSLTGYAPAIQLMVSVPVAALSLNGFAPSVGLGPLTIGVPAGALVLTGQSPGVALGPAIISVPAAALSLTGYAPVPALGPLTVAVPVAALSLTAYAPSVGLGPLTVNVPTGGLSLTGYAPEPVISADKTINVPAAALALTGYSPTVSLGPLTVNVPGGALALTGYAPVVEATDHKTVAVPAGALSMTGFAPDVGLGPLTVTVPTASLTMASYVPTVGLGPLLVNVPSGSLSLSGYAPSIALGPLAISVPVSALSLTAFAPSVSLGPLTVSVPVASLTMSGFAPSVSLGPFTIPVATGELALTGYAPLVDISGSLTIGVPTGALLLTGFAPLVSTTGAVLERQLAYDLATESMRVRWSHHRI